MTQSILLSQPKRLIPAIILSLKQLLSESQTIQAQRSIFDLKNKPTISFPQYLMRIFNFMGCSFTAYIYSIILIDKILEEHIDFKLTEKNIHRLLFTSIVIAAKFVDDKFYKNKYYASVGGIPLTTLNELEEQMLSLLNYHCPIDSKIFNSHIQRLEQMLQRKLEQQKSRNRSKHINNRKDLDQTTYQEQNDRRKTIRQKRQRSRQKIIQRNQDTQQSHQLQDCQ